MILINSAKDGKTAKKKQKREAQLSRAADVELAEISLEQHVLQQLSHRRVPASASVLDNGWIDVIDADIVSTHSIEEIRFI